MEGVDGKNSSDSAEPIIATRTISGHLPHTLGLKLGRLWRAFRCMERVAACPCDYSRTYTILASVPSRSQTRIASPSLGHNGLMEPCLLPLWMHLYYASAAIAIISYDARDELNADTDRSG